ncbi:uncharacterized protein LOC121796321 isoform X1 [Salvia splendens]|uniref:uncharacterized protein LOC121796321 isoform X1 n=1 Tax=Salvia splendens TaxID=180675 RepID=UPI001C25E8A3|nr:uncharacterized protein LOC121796321 isoform X1 [Salvia splendens]XP_042051091.1 uncharacterized protein LOC121796321 isoform X1 [Salvia splendens]XP_042051092.1 uncharacterized protein LOC121796321 isoform X1 [Salvia splendens]
MTGGRVSPKTENFCIKCKSNPLHGASFEIIDHISPVNEKCSITHCDPKPSERLSTPELISAVGHAWGYASKSLSGLLHKSNAVYEPEIIPEGGILRYSTDKGTSHAPTSDGDQPCSVFYLSSKEKSIELVDESRECSSDSYGASSFWRIVLARSMLIERASVQDCLLGAGIPSNFKSMYNWMNTLALCKPNGLVNSEIEIKRAADYYDNCRSTNSGDESSSFHSLATGISVSEPEISEPLDLSSKKAANFDLKPSNTTCSEKKDDALPIEATDCTISTSRCYLDSVDAELASHSYDCKNCIKESSEGTYEDQKDQGATLVKADFLEADISLYGKRKPQYVLAKHEHAFAGAMAGIFVSLCLHPVDTVKTVIQACHTSQKPVHYIGRSIIAERGISGLYRGISSNIVSSAPISAIYTFTYESVKKSLLPLLPKEYHSLAHCTAGGCASIATSFLFTPSECIKQQMQVSSHYKNCWTALIEILQKGGLCSLYAGWGAVLCRNVPHSVINVMLKVLHL